MRVELHSPKSVPVNVTNIHNGSRRQRLMPFFYIRQEKSEAWRVQLGTLLAVDAGFYRILFPGESDPVDMRVPWAVSLQHRGEAPRDKLPRTLNRANAHGSSPFTLQWQIGRSAHCRLEGPKTPR